MFFLLDLQKKSMKKILLIISIIAMSSSANNLFAQTESCSYDDMSMYFTGETKTEWGNLHYLYKCANGHAWWINQSSSNNNNSSSSDNCPTCDMGVYFTGETYTEWGKLYKVYKCASGHRSVGPY
tara:strand:- start:226 stop:600 length:375 start_codon:yes stop_codon:yes gene_type:complete